MSVIFIGGASGTDQKKASDNICNSLGNAIPLKFDEYLEEEAGYPPYLLFDHFYRDRKTITEYVNKACDSIVQEVEKNTSEGKNVMLLLHFTYFRRGHIIPNPALEFLLRKLNPKSILVLVDDCYHCLFRILQRIIRNRRPLFQELDPLSFLVWREAELSQALSLTYRGYPVYLVANKHDKRTLIRLVQHAFGFRKCKLAYISHHITMPRRKAIERKISLDKLEEVIEIQDFKRKLIEKCDNLVLFDPTTIDELIYDEDNNLKLAINKEDRWPFFESLHDDYIFPVDLSSNDFRRELYSSIDVKNTSYREQMRYQIEMQIESRDFLYINQSDMLIVYRPTMYNVASGIMAEIYTAMAQQKPVYAFTPHKEERQRKRKLFDLMRWIDDKELLFDIIRDP